MVVIDPLMTAAPRLVMSSVAFIEPMLRLFNKLPSRLGVALGLNVAVASFWIVSVA